MSPTEKSIIDNALQLFSEKGYSATSIRDISNAAGLTSASLYYYVNNKKDLLIRIMHTYMDKLISDAEDALSRIDKNNFDLQIAELIKTHVKNHGTEQLAALVVDNEYRSLKDEDKRQIQLLRKKYEGIWATVLYNGKQEDVFDINDTKITMFALIGLCTGVAHWYKSGYKYSIEEVADQYITLGLNMIAK